MSEKKHNELVAFVLGNRQGSVHLRNWRGEPCRLCDCTTDYREELLSNVASGELLAITLPHAVPPLDAYGTC